MSTPEERLAVISQNYQDALENEPHDLSRASTPIEVTGIQANVLTARETFYTSVAAELTECNTQVESAYKSAKDAQKAVKDARARAEKIPDIINKLKSATQNATKLLNVAKKS